MEDIINSWIGTGKNMPISPEGILKALGNDRLRGFSEKAGLPQEEISGGLASILPEIIDKLTPQGRIPDSSLLEEELKEVKRDEDIARAYAVQVAIAVRSKIFTTVDPQKN
jgi:uncharacterized protein YidB (DUF937 family)